MRLILAAFATFAALALTLAPSGPALAQKKPDKQAGRTDPRLAEAKKLFEDGAESYTQGNYEAAIAAWEKSYDISKRPLIFESIANAYERLGNPRKAREYLARWREVAPAEEQDILDARLKNLGARVAREEESEAARKAEEEKKKREREQQEQAGKTKALGPSLPGLVLAGSGGAAVIIGVALDIAASGKRPDLKTACGTANNEQICLSSARDPISSSNTLATVGDVLWIVGAAATAGGLALIFTQSGKPAEVAPRTTFVPAVTPRSAGFLIEHRF